MLKETVNCQLPGPLDSALPYLEKRFPGGHATRTYSQEGEDLVLQHLFDSCMSCCVPETPLYLILSPLDSGHIQGMTL